MPKQEIKVEFTQKGAPQLTKAIHNLANATNKLKGTQRIATQTAGKFGKTSQRVTAGVRDQGDALERLMKPLALTRNKLLLLGFGYGMVLAPLVRITKAAINQAAEFESLRTRLDQLYGSVAEGGKAFDDFVKHAAKTPYALQDIVNAGAQFKAFGGDSRALMGSLTDLAAFMGTTATEAANSLGRAFAGGAGAADILREKGILNLVKEFKGIEDLTELTLPEFREALIEAMQDPALGIAGATEVMASTYQGAISNMQDATQRMQAALGKHLIGTAGDAVYSFTGMANSIADFFNHWDESKMAKMVRQMKEMNIETGKLKDFELILVDEEEMDKIDELNTKLAETMLYAQGYIGQHGGSLLLFDPDSDPIEDWVSENILGVTSEFEKMNKEVEKVTGLIDGLFSLLQEAPDSDWSMAWWGAGGKKFQIADFVTDVSDVDSIVKTMETVAEVLAYAQTKISEAIEGEDPDLAGKTEYYTKMYRIYSRVNDALQTHIKIATDAEKARKALNAIDVDLPEPIFDEDDIIMIKEFTELIEKSNDKKREAIQESINFAIKMKEELVYGDERKMDLAEYNILFKELLDMRKKVTPFAPDLISGGDLMKKLHKQNDEYVHMQALLESLEADPSWKGILDNINVHSDAYKKQRGEVDDVRNSIKSIYEGTTQSKKKNLDNLLKEAIALKGNSEALKEMGLSALDVEIVILKLNEDINDLNKVIADEFLSDFDLFVQGIKDASAAEQEQSKYIKDVIAGVIKLNDVEMEYFKNKYDQYSENEKFEVRKKDFMESQLERIEQTKEEALWMEEIKNKYIESDPALHKLIQSQIFGIETYDQYIERLQALASEGKHLEDHQSHALANWKDLSPAIQEYYQATLLGKKSTEQLSAEIAKSFLISENQKAVYKEMEKVYHDMPDAIQPIIVALGMLSKEFMETHGIDGHKESIEALLETYAQSGKAFELESMGQQITDAENFISTKETMLLTMDKESDQYKELVVRLSDAKDGLDKLRIKYEETEKSGTKLEIRENKLSDAFKNSTKEKNKETWVFVNWLNQIKLAHGLYEGQIYDIDLLIAMIEDEMDVYNKRNNISEIWDKRVKDEIKKLKEKLATQQLDKQLLEEIIELEPELAKALGLVAEGYDGWLSKVTESNTKRKEELDNIKTLIATNPELAKELGYLTDHYADLLESIRKKEDADKGSIEAQKQLHRELRTTSDGILRLQGLIEGGYIKSWDELNGKVETAYDNIKKQVKDEIKGRVEQQKALDKLKGGMIEYEGVLYSVDRLLIKLGYAEEFLTKAELERISNIDELKSVSEGLRYTELEQIKNLQILAVLNTEMVDGVEQKILTDVEQERVLRNLYAAEQDIINAEKEIARVRSEQMSAELSDVYQAPGSKGKMTIEDVDVHADMFGYKGERRAQELSDLKEFYDEQKRLLIGANAEERAIIEKKLDDTKDKALEVMESGSMMDFVDNLSDASSYFFETMAIISEQSSERIERAYDKQMESMKESAAYKNATDKQKLAMEKKVNDGFKEEREKNFRNEQLMRSGQAAMATAVAIQDAVEDYGLPAAWPWIALIGALGMTQQSAIWSQKVPSFAQGGMVGGLSHSQGGTLIEAEAGEFVMSREAVEAMGVKNMERINNLATDIRGARFALGMGNLGTKIAVHRGLEEGRYEKGGLVGSISNNEMRRGSSEINLVVNFEGNVLSEDFIVDEAIPMIKDAIKRGELLTN